MIVVAGCTISPQKDPLPKLVKGFFVLGIDNKGELASPKSLEYPHDDSL